MKTDDPVQGPETGQADVDVALIRWMLSLTPEARLQVLQGFVDSASELRHERSAEV